MEETFINIITILLLVTPFIDWAATVILIIAARKAPNVIALKERATMATVLAISSTLSGILALARVTSTTLGVTFVVLLSISLLLTSVPNLYWLWLYYKRRLHG